MTSFYFPSDRVSQKSEIGSQPASTRNLLSIPPTVYDYKYEQPCSAFFYVCEKIQAQIYSFSSNCSSPTESLINEVNLIKLLEMVCQFCL